MAPPTWLFKDEVDARMAIGAEGHVRSCALGEVLEDESGLYRADAGAAASLPELRDAGHSVQSRDVAIGASEGGSSEAGHGHGVSAGIARKQADVSPDGAVGGARSAAESHGRT